ncbi:MAG: nucleotidyl transferase AbiEii/AbiGii toxin family protein [Verrucomicrobia bacterium]|nr:nucleotidyl transferase AbiEii/AbiGii toxin family protein [Verrucomicrobiota bacterium]
MNAFALEPAEERADFIHQFAIPAKIPAYIVEKDFWVCWLLGRIFATPGLGADCVFKGGTSLSKVFGAISRFSEDIDLGLSPASLGWSEADLDDAPSGSQRRKRMEKITADCAAAVENKFRTELEQVVGDVLGTRPDGGNWLTYELEAASRSPVLYFAFPQAVPPGVYVAPVVKIEFGSLTDQRPTGTHSIAPLIAQLAPGAFDDFQAEVVALEIERTFWEKATILHAEFHRPAGQAFRDRFARHYADFASLWRHPGGQRAAARLDLLARVRLHKSRYFGSAWANYATAVPGTLRILPPDARLAELRRDYAAMSAMFLSTPPKFEEMLATLREAEQALNTP